MRPSIAIALLILPASSMAADFPSFRGQVIDPRVGDVCYAVTTSDVDGDGKPDIVAVAGDAVVWYRNPSWEKVDVIRGVTERDNVCLQARDVDGDGRVDLFFTRVDAPPVLYHNTGSGFEDVSATAGFTTTLPTNGAAFGDIDNDGHLDLYVTTSQCNQYLLYMNDGAGHFTEQAVARGAAVTSPDSTNRQ